MTDNAWAYTNSRSLRLLLRSRRITHIRTRPYTPRTSGKGSSATNRTSNANGLRPPIRLQPSPSPVTATTRATQPVPPRVHFPIQL